MTACVESRVLRTWQESERTHSGWPACCVAMVISYPLASPLSGSAGAGRESIQCRGTESCSACVLTAESETQKVVQYSQKGTTQTHQNRHNTYTRREMDLTFELLELAT